MNYIRWFYETGKAETGLVGGKGANLGELTQAGLPVPPGFCVTSAAYKDFIRLNRLDQTVRRGVGGNEPTGPGGYKTPLSPDTDGDLCDTDPSPDCRRGFCLLHAAISTGGRGNPSGRAVVGYGRRSSQRLVRRAAGDLSQRARGTCTDRAHPALLGFSVGGAGLGLYRQPGSGSPIGFDVGRRPEHDPLRGCRCALHREPGHRKAGSSGDQRQLGIGEAIVSGLVSPDTITANKADGRIIDCQKGTKELLVAYAADGGTEELPVPEEMRSRPALTDQQVAELTRLGNRIEAYYGRPQDIEWGLYRGSWYLLQSRPITTLSLQPERHYPAGDFNRSMFIEIFPDPLSPIFLSVIEPLFKDMLDFTFRALGFEPAKDLQAIGGFYNQPYFNRDYIAAAFQPLSPAVREPLVGQIV